MTRPLLSLGAAALLAGCAGATATREVPAGPGPGRSASVRTLGVPPGHLPPVGTCRVWVPGVPPGRQARPRPCAGVLAAAPAGAMILYRPDRQRVRVRYVHAERVGVIVVVRLFEAESGRFVSEEAPGPEDRDEDEGQRGRRRGRP